MRDVLQALDVDHDGVPTPAEKNQAKIIFYGHSWGASEVATFARELERLGIPVLLTVQMDIVRKPGQHPTIIPANVEAAVNFYQSEGLLRGRSEIIAKDRARTEILMNSRMTFKGKRVDYGDCPWIPRTFNKPHHEIENDAWVWNEIATFIDSRISYSGKSSRSGCVALNIGHHAECAVTRAESLSTKARNKPGPSSRTANHY